MTTNRDLYELVLALPGTGRSLRDYLRALAGLVEPYRDADGLTYEQFTTVLREALTSEPAASGQSESNPFEGQLWQQVWQLGRLKPSRSPYDDAYVRGSDERWCNVVVHTFLECGAEGAFHGYQAEGDELVELPFLTWDELKDFLIQGQYYE